MSTRDPSPEVKVNKSLSLDMKGLILKPPKKWRQEMNSPELNILRRDKEVKEMLQETKES
jgi:hypothetical protein